MQTQPATQREEVLREREGGRAIGAKLDDVKKLGLLPVSSGPSTAYAQNKHMNTTL